MYKKLGSQERDIEMPKIILIIPNGWRIWKESKVITSDLWRKLVGITLSKHYEDTKSSYHLSCAYGVFPSTPDVYNVYNAVYGIIEDKEPQEHAIGGVVREGEKLYKGYSIKVVKKFMPQGYPVYGGTGVIFVEDIDNVFTLIRKT